MWLRRNLLSCLLAMREAQSTRAMGLTIMEKLKLPHIHRLGGGGVDILAIDIHGLECRNKIDHSAHEQDRTEVPGSRPHQWETGSGV